MENISTNNMYEHVKSIKNSCDKYRKENGGSCRGCIFNKLVYKDGDYDDFVEMLKKVKVVLKG